MYLKFFKTSKPNPNNSCKNQHPAKTSCNLLLGTTQAHANPSNGCPCNLLVK